jgi:hypothetical protein
VVATNGRLKQHLPAIGEPAGDLFQVTVSFDSPTPKRPPYLARSPNASQRSQYKIIAAVKQTIGLPIRAPMPPPTSAKTHMSNTRPWSGVVERTHAELGVTPWPRIGGT